MMDYQGPAIRLWMAFLAGAFVFQENTPENKLCVSDHVPSRGFCFPGKHTPKISYASLISFLAGAFVLGSVWGPFGFHLGPFGVHVGGRTAI